MMRFRLLFPILLFLILSSAVSHSQSTRPPSDPQAVAFASRSIKALTGGNAIGDVTLTGSVTWSGGAVPETGTATLLASGTGESRMNLTLPSGTRTEIRDASTGVAKGQWTAANGTSGLFASQNCATDAVWFFTALGSLAAGPGVVLTYVGPETRNGAAVQHIHSYIYQLNQSGATPSPRQLSSMDFYLDATSFLPVAITFNSHPDNNANSNLSVEIDFLSYQTFSGVTVPTHIQRSLQGNALVDITITGASFNMGLPLSDFTIN